MSFWYFINNLYYDRQSAQLCKEMTKEYEKTFKMLIEADLKNKLKK